MIRPIQWTQLSNVCWRADAPLFGSLRLEKYDTWKSLWSVPGYSFVPGNFDTLEMAMTATQNKYNALIGDITIES